MVTTKAFQNFDGKILTLNNTVQQFDTVLISDEPVPFVYDNANFLTKSFLITLCGYLETYIKDSLELLLVDINVRVKKEKFPYNLIRWNIEQKSKNDSKVNSLLDSKHSRLENLEIKIRKKDLDSFISGNPFRTKELFLMFGIDLESVEYFQLNKELINLIITKRNNILHHNDDASDLANSDITNYLKEIRKYALAIDKEIMDRIIDTEGHLIEIDLIPI